MRFIRIMHANNVKRLSFHQVQLLMEMLMLLVKIPTNPMSYGESKLIMER